MQYMLLNTSLIVLCRQNYQILKLYYNNIKLYYKFGQPAGEVVAYGRDKRVLEQTLIFLLQPRAYTTPSAPYRHLRGTCYT